ncbi:MAG: transaldolase [Candidatus Lokiarchaeota archaeon]|nr:transaldolase [Candidatus Lokiarchaeota archaeon]
MKYFLDSAKLDEIKYSRENWGIDGVTTNPRHIKASGKPFFTVIKEIAQEFKGIDFPISVEINPHLDRSAEMIAEAKHIAAMSENFVVKIPCTEQGLVAAKKLVEDDVKVNLTLVFTTSQAIQVARIGCAYCSPFTGWQEASGVATEETVAQIVEIYRDYGFDTEVIVAAVRSGRQIVDAALAGADIVTAAMEVYKESFLHPFTDKGLRIFQDAWDGTEIGKP